MFLEKLKVCEKYFIGLQMEAIDEHIQQFYFMSAAERKAHNQLRQLVVKSFLERCPLQPIKRRECIVHGANLDGTQLSFTRGPTNDVPFNESFNGRHQMGSYNQRQLNLHQDWLEKIQADELFRFDPTQSGSLQGLSQASSGASLISLFPDQVVWLQRASCATPIATPETWIPQTAAHLDAVLNSRFCTPMYVSKLREARQQATVLKKENSDNLEAILDKVNSSVIVNMSKDGEAELRNLDHLVFFAEMAKNENFGIVLNVSHGLDSLMHYLQEKGAQCSSVDILVSVESGKTSFTINQNTSCHVEDISHNVKRLCQVGDAQRISLVFADVDNSDELPSRRDFISLCIIALKLLEVGGMFVCHICETLTRFSVGILYILHQMFDELTILKPVMSQLSSPQRFLVCKGFQSNVFYPAYLENVLGQLVKLDCEKSALDVVEIVPMRLLYSEQFYSFVKKMNEQLAHLELQNIVYLENLYLYPEKMPSHEEISRLREEVLAYLK